jgi:hypothetical protein
MRQVLVFAAALSLSFAGISFAAGDPGPYKLDAKGNCHAADGKFAKKSMCAGAAAKTPAATPAADPKAPYKLDAKGKCHDVKGKMAPKAKCAA